MVLPVAGVVFTRTARRIGEEDTGESVEPWPAHTQGHYAI